MMSKKAYRKGLYDGIDLVVNNDQDFRDYFNDGFNTAIEECYNFVLDFDEDLANTIKSMKKEIEDNER